MWRWCRLLMVSWLLTSIAACDSRPSRAATTRPGDDHDNVRVMDSVHIDLTAAGATLPYPLYARWFNEYAQVANLRINYLSVGSGEGVTQLREGRVDVGASDVPVVDTTFGEGVGPVLHVPTVIGAVAISYNLPRQPRPLRLDATVLGDIFLGRITRWNDPRLRTLNPDASLPSMPIAVVHRADASGTSSILSDYLRMTSPAWRAHRGASEQTVWPTGRGVVGNESVAALIRQTPGAMGYLEVRYARVSRLPTAHLRNRAGRFVGPSPYEMASAATAVWGTSSAGDSTRRRASDLRRSLIDAPGASSYPLASATWLLLPTRRLGTTGLRQIEEFLDWAYHEAQHIPSELGYVPLPAFVAEQVLSELHRAGNRP